MSLESDGELLLGRILLLLLTLVELLGRVELRSSRGRKEGSSRRIDGRDESVANGSSRSCERAVGIDLEV